MQFKTLTGHDPYPHQIATYEALAKGESIILRAPTGSGKSEAVFVPFDDLRSKSLPNRMIYSLPMRALVNSLHERFKGYAPHLDVKAQHGKRTESLLFDADCIVATLDQTITSYACAPLSLGVRHGNIPAGAVVSSFLVFDEVHTFEPMLGLQSSLILAERMKNLGIAFVIMSATLPSNFMNSLSKRLEAKVIDVDEASISARNKRKVFLKENLKGLLSHKEVLKLHNNHAGRTIVVCNTVDRAIKLFSEVKDKIKPAPILIHSRFLDDDRARKEQDIKRLFGKDVKEKAMLITTQVIEVGMDISCDLLITELAPIDALIQRAGRCARWGGEGNMIVFEIPHHSPYEKNLVADTRVVIEKYENEQLTWLLEKNMVDEVLDDVFIKYSKPESGAKAMAYLSRGAFEGKPAIAEKAVREALSVEVSIHDNPESLGNRVLFLPRCKIHPGSLKRFIKEKQPKVWLLDIDKDTDDDYRPRVEAIPINSDNKVYPNRFYVIHSDYASYHSEQGLHLDKRGTPLEPVEAESALKEFSFNEIPHETWKEHALKTIEVFEKYILSDEEFVYSKIAHIYNIDKEKLLDLFRFVLAIHDLGKLTEEWQKKIGAKDNFLAHSGNIEKIKLPSHATVSAYVLIDYLRKNWGNILGDAAFFAIAHHHSVRAAKVPKYRLCDGWYNEANKVLSEMVRVKLEWEDVKKYEEQKSPATLSNHFPAFEKEQCYNFYVILSRALRLADRKAVGGTFNGN